jgi:GntR family galactonate operon transcriptional repressor
LIQSRPKVGTQVRPRRDWNLFDADVLLWKLKVGDRLAFLEEVTEVRRIIESEAARYAAERAGAGETVAIAAAYRDLENILAAGADYHYERYLELDMAFHTAILDACHNALLAQIGYTMRQAVQTARRADIRDLDILRDSLPSHLAMATAIAAHDPVGAKEASLAMFDEVWAHMPKGNREEEDQTMKR